ncbi:MerR family transcriptional regulator [Paracoccus rhizosphaerae]|uniref:MerR family transcriptional regulator n=1 Tax=Paracoccus rhizosphaerae TaxID=1133347 RepID=A0ABV6CDV1_9RHOB|nr:MerR family transcriptional regulator [Paracoccus rhizosphaerae]
MAKGSEAFRSIGEVAKLIGVAPHVLRYWETQFPLLRPMKRPDGRRYYRPADLALAAGLVELLRDEGLTIRGARMALAPDRGEAVRARGLARLSSLAADIPAEIATMPDNLASGGEGVFQDEPATALSDHLMPLSAAEAGARSEVQEPGVVQAPVFHAADPSLTAGEPAAMPVTAAPVDASASDLSSKPDAGTVLQKNPPNGSSDLLAQASDQAPALWLHRLTHLARRLQQVHTLAPDAVQAQGFRLLQAMLRLS